MTDRESASLSRKARSVGGSISTFAKSTLIRSKSQPGRPQAAEGRMFVTYPQSGNGQRQVMSDHRRNMFLSFHLVVVSRDPRVRVSLSLSQAIGSRNKMLLRSDGCFPSPALPPRRKGHDMRCARPWAVLDAQLLQCGAALTRVRVYTPQTGGGQPVNPRTWSLRDFPESLAEGIYIPLCASGPQPRQFGGVCLTSEHRHHAIPSYIT
jgi:hypothetical protein